MMIFINFCDVIEHSQLVHVSCGTSESEKNKNKEKYEISKNCLHHLALFWEQ